MEKEILVLTDSIGVDGQNKKKHIWIGELRIIAWKDDALHIEEKVVKWATTYDGLMEISNIISGNMIIKLLVEDKDTHFNLIKVLEAPITDLELDKIKQKSQKPIYYQDELLGKFKFDKQFNWFTKKINWDTEKGHIYVHNADEALLNLNFKYLATLLEAPQLQRVKSFAAKELSPLTKEWSGEFLSAPELHKYLTFKELVINSDGSFTVHLGASKIFSDHDIYVEGNPIHGLTTAYL